MSNDSNDSFLNFDLFRKEAVAAYKNRISGVVLLYPTISQLFLSIAILTICLIVAAFLCFASFSEQIRVRGWIEPSTGLTSIYAPTKGQVEEVSVRLGQEVSIGDPLIIISATDGPIKANQTQIIKSQVNGIVTNINLERGQFFLQNTSLVTIWPKSSKLLVKLLIPVSASGLIEFKQKLKLQYDAFPYRRFGLHDATITWIAESAVQPNEMQKFPVRTVGAAYLVEAALDSESILAYGKHKKLKPGMTLSADIYIGSRSLYEWIFDPFLVLANRI